MITMAEYSSNQKGWVAAGKVVDAESGRPLRTRTALRQIEDAMRAGQVDAVLATEPSRFSRRHSELAYFIGLAERCGVQVWTTTTGPITNMMAVALHMVAGLGLDDQALPHRGAGSRPSMRTAVTLALRPTVTTWFAPAGKAAF